MSVFSYLFSVSSKFVRKSFIQNETIYQSMSFLFRDLNNGAIVRFYFHHNSFDLKPLNEKQISNAGIAYSVSISKKEK